METLYRSCDGIIYDNKEKCLDHEKEIENFIMLDFYGGRVYHPSKAKFIVILTDEDAKKFFEYFDKEKYNSSLPWTEYKCVKKGLYVYNDENDDWDEWSFDIIKTLYQIIKQGASDSD